jgi:hypothetical protein
LGGWLREGGELDDVALGVVLLGCVRFLVRI